MKLWSGRFDENTDALTDELNASITFDQRMFREDIEGSIAHAEMLGECGIIEKSEVSQIVEGLRGVLSDIESGALTFSLSDEDIHMGIEGELTRRIGDAGKRLHTARSRNDQVALDLRLYLRKEMKTLEAEVLELIETLCGIAEENLETVMPAYTHLQRAQPTTLAHHMMAYAFMLKRDVERLRDCRRRMNVSPLGSGALTGTTYQINRMKVAKALEFDGITDNSLDGVSDRDYALELLSALSIIMTHMSRLAEEVIMWCSWEFRFVSLSDKYSTGSSIMPQKKNPDIAELVRGKTGRVYGDLMGLLTVMKALPLAYNKDMQEDKERVFDAVDTVKKCLPVFTAMLATMTVNKEKMRKAAAEGFINATDCADYLVKKGLPFRDAYTVVGRLVNSCIAEGKTLEALTLEEYKSMHELFDADVFEAIALETCIEMRKVPGGPSRESVTEQIKTMRSFLTNK